VSVKRTHLSPSGIGRAAHRKCRFRIRPRPARLLDTYRAGVDVAPVEGSIPAWIAPTIAISLVIIAASMLTVGAVTLLIGLGLRNKSRAVSAQLSAFTADAKIVASRLRHEVDSYADLSTEARLKLQRAVDAVETRLQHLDTLAEVFQEELDETALSAASFMRTVRNSGKLFGVARRALRRKKRAEGED
jgi:hypothetical protein